MTAKFELYVPLYKRHRLRERAVWYVYPIWHTVSFTLIARKHLQVLRRVFRLYEIDELSFYHRDIYSQPLIFLHPYFFIAQKNPVELQNIIYRSKALIGIDVADSDALGRVAVQLANMAHAMVVPSTFSKEAYERSGVKVPVYVVPHPLDPEYYGPRQVPKHEFLRKLYEEKRKNRYIYVLFILIHSGERKGAPLVYEVMKEILKMYPNVKLVVKVGAFAGIHFEMLNKLTKYIFCAFLDTSDMVALFDMCDIYTGFSVGGGFEMNFLEAIARNCVCIAAGIGSWTDYLPDFCLVKKVHRVKVFPNADSINSIHCGYGYAVDVQAAIDKIKDVIENLDDYKARLREHWEKIKDRYTVESVGQQLVKIALKYL